MLDLSGMLLLILLRILFLVAAQAHLERRINVLQRVNAFQMDFGTDTTLCPAAPHNICGDNVTHFLCQRRTTPAPICKRFRKFSMTKPDIVNMINGHNGLRNKVAGDFGISNMNLLYWSYELQDMAEAYLFECKRYQDSCLSIGEHPKLLNQNYIFRKSRKLYPPNYWVGRTVRRWYLEIGIDTKEWSQFVAKSRYGMMNNFTQLAWPATEFVGCGGATMYNGFLVNCYYYPAMNIPRISKVFKFGDQIDCPEKRLQRSKLFHNLCGIDIVMDHVVRLRASVLLIALVSFAILKLFY